MSDISKKRIVQTLGVELESQVLSMTDVDADRLATIMAKPNVQSRINRSRAPFSATLYTNYGSILLDGSLTNMTNIYVNGQKFGIKENGLDAIEKATGTEDQIKDVLGEEVGRQRRGRKVRSRVENNQIPLSTIQEYAFNDLKKSGLSYESLFTDLGGLMDGQNVDLTDISDELFSNNIDEDDIAHFLIYDSQYKNAIMSQVYGANLGNVDSDYNFITQKQDDTFAGRLLSRLGVDEAHYDPEAGVMNINGRHITNLPQVDDNGVFHTGDTSYLPYYVGYFAAGAGTKAERLRVIDPTQSALDSLALQYSVSYGDIKFKTILDVTRNLPDFENHPYGDAILDTLKHKVVIDKSYGNTNSLIADYSGKADDLGAIATMILDPDAKGLVDPLGTSNGANMGKVLYLADGVKINDDGTMVKSDQEYSKVGQVLKNFNIERDNFNRNQMSFNAFLTSTDVKKVNVAYAEFALWNSDDALVMTKSGADKAFDLEKFAGDKVMDMHGNKSTISLIIDPTMDAAEAKEKHLTNPVKFAQDNPNVDMIVSPLSIASRLNMGVPQEALAGQKQDLILPDGKVVQDGVVEMMYMSLPQTAEHKSKNYEVEGTGRRYSTLLHYSLASKVGDDLYNKALINDDVKQGHIDQINATFNRLGVSFTEPDALIKPGNVNLAVDAPVEVDAKELSMLTPSVIRTKLMTKMQDGKINVNLGKMRVISPLTNQPIVDSFGEHVLPISVDNKGTIPYRYTDVFKAISLGNADALETSFERASAIDNRALTRKDNLLKNINTMVFTNQAHTDVLLPDPTLNIDQVRSTVESDRVIVHRDPAIHSSSVISMNNIGGGEANVTKVNPLIEVHMDADNDGDTVGAVGYDNLTLSEAEKQDFFDKSSAEEQVNNYGEVFLGVDGHFKAAMTVNKFDCSNLTFKDGKSNEDLVKIVNRDMKQIVDSPKSYGAYALSFTNEVSTIIGLDNLAADGIKGKQHDIEQKFKNGYTDTENVDVLKALIAKSEWTGLAGATTNNVISGLSDMKFDAPLVRVSEGVSSSMTAYVLHALKKDASQLPIVDKNIKAMKTVFSGEYGIEESRDKLKAITEDLLPPAMIDDLVDQTAELQDPSKKFGVGVFNHTETTTTKLAYATGDSLGKALINISNDFQQQK